MSRKRASKLDNQLVYGLDFQPKVTVGKGPHDAKAIADELLRIEARKRALRPVDVVDAARDPTNPLHRYFDWEDTLAAQRWREEQARGLIASVRVSISSAPERPPMRAFLHVPSPDNVQHYGSAAKVMSDPERRQRMVWARSAKARGGQVWSGWKGLERLGADRTGREWSGWRGELGKRKDGMGRINNGE